MQHLHRQLIITQLISQPATCKWSSWSISLPVSQKKNPKLNQLASQTSLRTCSQSVCPQSGQLPWTQPVTTLAASLQPKVRRPTSPKEVARPNWIIPPDLRSGAASGEPLQEYISPDLFTAALLSMYGCECACVRAVSHNTWACIHCRDAYTRMQVTQRRDPLCFSQVCSWGRNPAEAVELCEF